MTLDLASLALKADTEIQLRHPVSGELLFADEDKTEPVTVSLWGSASKQYRNAVAEMQNRALKRQAKKEKPTAEVMREEGIRLLLAVSAGSKNLVLDGNPVITEDDFRTLYSNPAYSWVKDQVDEALADTSNFLAQ
jgi:hypothetical protein